MILQKKIGLLVFSIGFLISLTNPARAEVFYDRTPSGEAILSPVSFDVSFDSISDFADCESQDPAVEFWYLCLGNDDDGTCDVNSESIDILDLDEVFILSPPAGNYYGVYAICNEETLTSEDGIGLEVDPGNVIFTILAEEGFVVDFMPENAVSSTTNVMGELINSLWIFIELAIGIPLAFWFVGKMLKMMP